MAELTAARIARAGLEVADEQGASGFSMRLVAERLGVTPMALYHHVDDKAALVALLVDEVIAETPLPSTTGSVARRSLRTWRCGCVRSPWPTRRWAACATTTRCGRPPSFP